MWIRSQDLMSLVNCKRIIISETREKKYKIIEQHSESQNYDNYDLLGIYETQERAIFVLGMIHNKLISYQPNIESQYIEIYSMPSK